MFVCFMTPRIEMVQTSPHTHTFNSYKGTCMQGCVYSLRWNSMRVMASVIIHINVDYGQKGYGLDSKTLIVMAKKSRNKNHSNYFNIKFMPWLTWPIHCRRENGPCTWETLHILPILYTGTYDTTVVTWDNIKNIITRVTAYSCLQCL